MKNLTHLDPKGQARMVNVSAKKVTRRRAVAESTVHTTPKVLTLLKTHALKKGDVLAVARVAGILAAKRVHELIPLCHPLPLDAVTLDFETGKRTVRIVATVECTARTGAEMEALTAASVAALTIYDMVKSADRALEINGTRLV